MAKAQCYTATSIDGFIADEHNSLDGLSAASSADKKEDRFGTFFAGVGAMAMGATTHEWLLEHDQLLEHRPVVRSWRCRSRAREDGPGIPRQERLGHRWR